jgi:hypothetical protein
MDDVDDFSAPKESVEDIKKARDSFFGSFSTANKKVKQDKTSNFTNTVTNEL